MITSHLENTRRVWRDRKPDPDIALEEEYLQAQVRLAQAKRKNKRKKVSIEGSTPSRDRLPKACAYAAISSPLTLTCTDSQGVKTHHAGCPIYRDDRHGTW